MSNKTAKDERNSAFVIQIENLRYYRRRDKEKFIFSPFLYRAKLYLYPALDNCYDDIRELKINGYLPKIKIVKIYEK